MKKFKINPLAFSVATLLSLTSNAQSQTATEVEEVIVSGFRASLNAALTEKKESVAAVDSIVAEDIGKFPDSNLAESMQRIPGVALARGDGGEGKNISVRGLGAAFTRVRLNGMEGTAQTGSSDIYGAGNTGRSFDFNVFPSEIFSELTVRKTPSADVEEGSLGATVDLKAPHPLSFDKDTVLTASIRGVNNEISESTDPKASLLASKKFADGKFGVLASFAYSDRNIREVGYSAVNILPTYVNGGFCSPIGYATQNPATSTAKGVDALNCSTGNPRTSDTAAYNLIQGLTGVSGKPGGGVFLPRIPRYINSDQDAERTGGTFTLEWQPDDNTTLSLDNLYSQYDVVRRDNYIDALSFARNINNNGQPMVSVKQIEVDSQGSLIYGLFDGVDLRSESLVDRFKSTFEQHNVNFSHKFSDTFEMTALVGHSTSIFDNPERLTVNLDAIDTDNFSIDFRKGGSIPVIKYGIDVANPANFTYAPGQADGTVLGNFNTRNWKATTSNYTNEVNFAWDALDYLKVKFGLQSRESSFKNRVLGIAPTNTATTALPVGTTVSSFTRTINGIDDLLISGALSSYVGVDHEKWKQAVGFKNFAWCGIDCGLASPEVRETINSIYMMGEFRFDELAVPIRGDAGIRYVETDQHSVGYIPVTAPSGSKYPTIAQRAVVDRPYEDTLPSANVVFEFTPTLQGRLSAAKVMSRAELGVLTPSGSMNATTRTASIGNPYLDPIRAKTFDASVEWYFSEGALASVAYFQKDISSYIQSISSLIPYNQTGLPESLLVGSAASATDSFTVTRVTNTDGGVLKGLEYNLQLPLSFLPSVFQNMGVLANYTQVTSKIDYVLQSANGVPTLTTTADLVGLSKNAASATVYYEDDLISLRATGSYRGGYLRSIPSGGNDSDVLGNHSTFYVDASASYNLTESIKLILEAQNLTDEHNVLYIDSKRKDPLFDTRTGVTISFGVNMQY